MANVDDMLAAAMMLHREERLAEARAQYEQIVALDPARADAWNLLGIALRQEGRPAEALPHHQRAVTLDPIQAIYAGNLGEAHRLLGDLEEALRWYTEASRLAPFVAEIHNTLGALAEQTGRPEEAEAHYQHAIQCDPRYPEAIYNLGNFWQKRRQWDRAIEHYQRALALRPDYVDAQCNLGNALRERGDLAGALAWLRSALALAPDSVPAMSNLGAVLQDMDQPEEALDLCLRAIARSPERPMLHMNLGTIYKDLQDPAAAIASYNRALQLEPDHAQALFSRGTAYLSQGDFAEGWAGYEVRSRCEQFDTRDFPQPRWDGAPLAGRTLLVHSEQGLGDTVQFIRYLPRVMQSGGRVLVDVQPALVPLLRTSGVPNVLPPGEPLPAFDVHVPLLSLPYIFGTRLETVPADVPYLAVEPERVEKWRAVLEPYAGLKVGLVWQGRVEHRRDRMRSFPLVALAPLATVPGVQLFSLQKGPGSEQLAALAAKQGGGRFEVIDLGSAGDNDGAVFRDTAAIIQNLDLVIAPDTGVAHLAGALAARVWVALPLVAEWRWLTDRDDSPWYPTLRLFRQQQRGDWAELFARMAGELATLVTERGDAGSTSTNRPAT
ncbi:MAG: tetratricopeptide repeat protein [Pirellulales bacterium]